MNHYHILSPESHIAAQLDSDESAERRFFNIIIHDNSAPISDDIEFDIVIATHDFWLENIEWLKFSGCKVCVHEKESCSFDKENGLYTIRAEAIEQPLLTHLISVYSAHLVYQSSSKEWKMYYKALISEPNPIIVTDKNGIINFMNAKAELEFKLRLKNLKGVLFQSLFKRSSQNGESDLTTLVNFYNQKEISRHIPELSMILPSGRKNPYSVTLNRMDMENLGESPVKINLKDASDIHLMEEELLLKEAAVEQTQNGVMITDNNLGDDGPLIRYVNPRMEEITGYKSDELIGRNPRLLQGPKTDKQTLIDLNESIGQGKVYKASAINYRKDGGEYFVEWNISPIRNKHGHISHYVSIQQDKSEEVKRTSVFQRLAKIVENSSSAVFTLNEDGTLLSVNKSASDLIGVGESEAKGKSLFEYLSSDFLNWEKVKNELINKGTLTSHNSAIQINSGERIVADFQLYYLESEFKNIRLEENYIALLIDDVTDKQRANRVLEDASEKAKIGGWELNLQNKMIYLSSWTAKVLQLDETKVSYDKFIELFPEATKRLINNNYSKSDGVEVTESFQIKDSKRFYQISGSWEPKGDEKIWRGLLQDVTESLSEEVQREWRKQITEKIARGVSTQKIYADINAFVEEEVEGARSIITFFKNNYVYDAQTNSLDEYRKAILNSKIIPDAGPCSDAFLKQKPIIAPEICQVKRWSLFQKLVEPMEVRASWSYPIEVSGTVLATMALFFTHERSPGKKEEYVIETAVQIIKLLVEREEQQKSLLETTQKLEVAQGIAGIGDWILNIDERRFSYFSKNILSMFGLEDVNYQSESPNVTLNLILEQVVEDDRKFVEDIIRDTISERTNFDVTYRVGPVNGEDVRYLKTTGEYADSREGASLRGITQNVTESKLAEIKLIQSLDMWSSLVNTQPNPLIIVDKSTIEYLNPAAQKILGVEDDVLDSSMSLFDYVVQEDIKVLKRFLNSPFVNKENNIKISLRAKNGIVNHVIVRSANIVYEGKTCKQLVLSDITKMVHTQVELQRVRNNLEQRVLKRTEELTSKNAQLQHEVEKRKKIEEELLYTSVQLSTIFNHSNQIFVLLDDQFNIISFNERASQWSNRVVKKELQKHRRFDEYDVIGIAEDYEDRYKEALGGTTSQSVRKTQQDDGKTRWIQVEYIPVREKKDEPCEKVLFVATDITDQKLVEIELRDSKKLLESINEHVSQGIFRLSSQNWLYTNKGLLNLLEVADYDKIDNYSFKNFFKFPDEYRKIITKLRNNESVENYEVKIVSRSGKICDVLLSAFVQKGKYGEIKYIDGTVVDITSRKKAEIKLRESEKLYRDLFENMSQGVIYHQPDGKITNINNAACRILGQTRDQLLGISSLDPQWKVINEKGEALQGHEHPVMKSFELKKPVTNEMIGVYRPDHNDVRWLNVHAQAQFDENTCDPLNAVVTFEDVTPLKLANEQIEAARKQTEQMALAKEQFLANMSHEIRTPMSGIKGMAYLLNRTELDKDQTIYVKNIIESSQNLLVIINDILDISKIESGKISFENSAFSIKKVVESVIDMMRVQVGEHLEIISEINKNVPEYVIGDSSRLNQILFNLAGNAVKFTDEGYVTVKVESVTSTEQKCKIKITVEDTGIGIDEEKLESIFDIFTQVDGSSTKKYGGTGLGLHITKRLVEMQGGSIEVLSKRGIGSLFTVFIPFSLDKNLKDEAPDSRNSVDLKNIDILVVDDNAVNSLWAEKLLEKWNVNVHTASGGLESIEFLKENYIDVILMDIQMPEMNGYETTQFIRKNLAGYEQTPIIGVTADVLRNQMEKCQQAGMDTYLAKPYEPDEMLNVLSKFLHNKIGKCDE